MTSDWMTFNVVSAFNTAKLCDPCQIDFKVKSPVKKQFVFLHPLQLPCFLCCLNALRWLGLSPTQSEKQKYWCQGVYIYFSNSVKVHQRSMPKSSLKTQPSECWSKYFWNSPMSMWLPLMHSFRTPTSLKPSNFLQDKTSTGPLTCPSSSTLSLKITVFQNVSRYFLFWEQSCAYINEINSWIESVVLDIANNFFCCTKLCNAAHLIIFHCQFLTMPHQQLTSVAEP